MHQGGVPGMGISPQQQQQMQINNPGVLGQQQQQQQQQQAEKIDNISKVKSLVREKRIYSNYAEFSQ